MSDENFPVRDLSKVANNLINKISKAVGVAYAPIHTRRMAKAEADAKIILALGDEAATDVQRRAAARWLHEEQRNQENIEAVTRAAIPDLTLNAKPEELDDDWLTDFFGYAKKVSNEEMRSLWGKILAGQVNAPGSFRKRTLQAVSLFEKEDAEIFGTLCRFGVNTGHVMPLVFVLGDSIYKDAGLDFAKLTHLDALGLVRFDSISGFARAALPNEFNIAYGQKRFQVTLPQGRTELDLGHALLTEVGSELLQLSNAQVVPGFDDYFIAQWEKSGIKVAPIDSKASLTSSACTDCEAPDVPTTTGL